MTPPNIVPPILISAVVTFFALFLVVPFLFGVLRAFGVYTSVEERQCRVYVLFGKVLAAIQEPGLHILPLEIGPAAFIVNFFGNC
jgi:hypothetical protein